MMQRNKLLNAFGSIVNNTNDRVDVVLTSRKKLTMKQIQSLAHDPNTCYEHLNELIKKGLVIKDEQNKTFTLTKDADEIWAHEENKKLLGTNYSVQIQEARIKEDELKKIKTKKPISKFHLNIILYGPPGTGKTFRTKQIAIDLLESISKFKNNVIKENTEASVLSSGANVWIFQGNPNKYNIVGALSDPNYNIDSWTVLQSTHQIKKGDIALLWMAGDKAGIYALCEIISDPMMIKASYDKYWNDSEKNVNRLGVKINLIKNLVSDPIFREEIKNTPGLENLAILKFANATNFMVKNDEWLIIKKLIDIKAEKRI